MKFRSFMLIWVILVAGISTLVVIIPQTQRNMGSEGKAPPHFSVLWKGFLPSYSNQTPDYYICINNLKDDVLRMYIALQIQNFENSSYWFMIDKYGTPPAGWNVSAYYIGKIEVDTTITFTYSSLTREKPSSISEGRITETVPLVVKAYYDASYSSLYSQANFTVRFHFIDLTSPVWTQLYYDNFDDGQSHGWYYGSVQWYQYYRSWPCSLRYPYHLKDFDTTGPFTEVYMVFALRPEGSDDVCIDFYPSNVQAFQTDIPTGYNTWYQFAIPLPNMPTLRVYIHQKNYNYNLWLDDVYVIAK